MNQAENKIGHSIRVEVEKLDGGFISNITGKRRIYKDAFAVDEVIDMKAIINNLEENEYMLNIDIIPKELYADFLKGAAITAAEIEEEDIRNKAIQDGIIQKADEFNPNKPVVEEDLHAPISIDIKSAYTAGKLKSINWAELHDQLPMTVSEKAEIAGIKKINMYALSANAISGKAMFQNSGNRIAFTILHKYYERHLGLKTNAKDKMDTLKEGLLVHLRDLELMASKGNYTKSTVIAVSIGKMRKLLL